MKKTYKLKEEQASAIEALFGIASVKEIERRWNNEDHKFSIQDVEYIHVPIVHLISSDSLTFIEDDFETVVTYDPEGWNTFPDCKPTKDENKKYFIVYVSGYIPLICSWDEENSVFIDVNQQSVDGHLKKKVFVSCTGEFMFKQFNLPKES